jgi:cellulose synthase/poly-beta-1,6-N-acetylglucosamine synthase-like glycosyltransferase
MLPLPAGCADDDPRPFFWLLCRLYRYVRFLVNCVSHWTFRPIPLPDNPTLGPGDVTIIIPTLDGDGDSLRQTIQSCLATEPFEILLVTIDANYGRLSKLVQSIHSTRLRTFSVPRANKRRQMCCAIPEVSTKITIFADDDVIWPPTILSWVLAAFEKPEIGGVGTCQRLRRAERPNVWSFLGAIYLERRNFEISATTHLDGGISCLSGRTVAYRTHILQDPAFTYDFTHEYWREQYQLNTDDDNFITRWMLSHGWRTHVQYCKEAEVLTTLEDNPKFLKQCLRWSRSNWRSNLTSMFSERLIWRSVCRLWTRHHSTRLSPPNHGRLLCGRKPPARMALPRSILPIPYAPVPTFHV